MARQAGPIFFTGTIDDITFYQLDGKYYARRKSSLNRKQFLKNPAFARSRVRAAQFGVAVKIAKVIYYQLPKEQRKENKIGKLTGMANRLLQLGHSPDEATSQLQMVYVKPKVVARNADKQLLLQKCKRYKITNSRVGATPAYHQLIWVHPQHEKSFINKSCVVAFNQQITAFLLTKLIPEGKPITSHQLLDNNTVFTNLPEKDFLIVVPTG